MIPYFRYIKKLMMSISIIVWLKNIIYFVAMIVMVALIVLISVDPPQVLFGAFLIYTFWGPVFNLLELKKRQAERLERENRKTDVEPKGTENNE